MGMDLNIYSARNREVFKHEGWWESDQVQEEFYGRKAWHYPEHCSFIPRDYENGDFIEITLENLEEMVKVACEYQNYWNNYEDVPKLCKLRDKYREWEYDEEHPKHNYKLFLEYDW